MCRGLVTVVALLIAAPAASAARAQITIQATPASGAAPLHVAFSAADAVALINQVSIPTSA